MKYVIYSNNTYLSLGIQEITSNIKEYANEHCNPTVMIMDISSIELLANKDIDFTLFCAAVVFINKESEANSLQYFNLPFPIKFILLTSHVNMILDELTLISLSLSKRVFCSQMTEEQLSCKALLTLKENIAIRMYFREEKIVTISEYLNLGYKTSYNYCNNALKILGLNYSIDSYNIIKALDRTSKFAEIKFSEIKCLVRTNYLKTMIFTTYKWDL